MQERKAKGAQMPGHPNCRAFGGSTESAQGGLGRPPGAEAVSLAELVPGSWERLQLGQGSAVSVLLTCQSWAGAGDMLPLICL